MSVEEESKYIIILNVTRKPTQKECKVIVTHGEFGVTTSPFLHNLRYADLISNDAKLFDTEGEAKTFAEEWEAHPWYYEPTGDYEIIRVKPQYHEVLKGYIADEGYSVPHS